MDEVVSRLEMLYHAGSVKRAHSIPTLFNRTISEHVYGCLIIAVELCKVNGVDPGPALMALLYHDAPEVETGDVPANVKKADVAINNALAKMEMDFEGRFSLTPRAGCSPIHLRIVEASDNLDFLYLCLTERRMGNNHPYLRTVFKRSSEYLQRHADVPGVYAIATHIFKEWTYLEPKIF